MARGQAVGEPQAPQRVLEGLTLVLVPLCPCVLSLLGAQMVAVNLSSPTAAGPWDGREMEESMTTSDGNAESLYMQGTGQEVASAFPGWGSGNPRA